MNYGDKTYFFVNGKEIFKFKADNKNVNFPTQICLGSISNGFGAAVSREVFLKGNAYDFSVDCNAINKSKIPNSHKYLMVKINIKTIFGLIKQVFNRLLCFSQSLSRIASTPDHVICISLYNQQCMTQPTLINLHPNALMEGLRYCPFAVNLDRCMGSCNNLNNLSKKVCIPHKTEDLNLSVFNMIIGIIETKILTKHISSECKCKFDGNKCNLIQNWNDENVDGSTDIQKNIMHVKKIIFGILLHYL